MLSHSTFGVVVICAAFSLASSARINLHVMKEKGSPDKLDSVEECGDLVAQRTGEIVERIAAFYGPCGVSDEHLSEEYEVSEEGKALLCKESCKDLPVFADAPDSSVLIKECTDEDTTPLRMHDAFEAARASCAEAPLLDLEDEDASADENSGEPVDSPVAPLKGKRIKQQKFEYELKGALADVHEGKCDTLKKVFKQCDYKKAGEVFIQKVDDMLDILEESQKAESIGILKQIAKKAGKAETDPLTFKDWTFFKLDMKDATKCALEYAMNK